MDWKLYYEDGTRFTSEDGPPDCSPEWGLVAIKQRVGKDYMPLTGDYFTYRGRWYNHDFMGLIDELVHFAGDVTAVRVGRYVDDHIYQEIIKELM